MFDALDLLVLRELPGVGERTLERLLERIAGRGLSLHAVLGAPAAELQSDYDLPPTAIARLVGSREKHLARCRTLRAELDRAGTSLLTRDLPSYPSKLRHNLDLPPPLLFALGNTAIADQPAVSILASREILGHTMTAMVAVIRKARDQGLAVVTGGMKSTHRLSAMTCRAFATDRLIVLDRGLSSAFASDYGRDPFGCGPRSTLLDRAKTLVLSPFRPEDHAAPGNGRRRDEIIAALGDVVFAISATPGGETERICAAALERGQPLLLWQHNSSLIQRGAVRVGAGSITRGLTRFLHPTSRPGRGPAC